METNGKFEVDVRDVEYQSLAGKPWLARVYQPKGSGPFPTIVDVHGGAWHNGDRTNNAGIDEALAARGILVAAVDFRQPPEAGYPASICDINLAVRWLKSACGRAQRNDRCRSVREFQRRPSSRAQRASAAAPQLFSVAAASAP